MNARDWFNSQSFNGRTVAPEPAPANPVADILAMVAADPNIQPAFRAALPSADPAWLQYRREEERAFPEIDGEE